MASSLSVDAGCVGEIWFTTTLASLLGFRGPIVSRKRVCGGCSISISLPHENVGE